MRSFGTPVAKLGPNVFQYISAKAGLDWLTSRNMNNIFVEDLHMTTSGLRREWGGTLEPPSPPKKKNQKTLFFGDLGFPSFILVNKSLKALCLSSKMVYQHLLHLLSCGLLTSKDYPRSNSFFFQWEF